VGAEIFVPLFIPHHHLVPVIHRYLVVSRGGDCLQILEAQHGSHSGAARGPLTADDGGVFNKIFACGTYAYHAALDAAAALVVQLLLQVVLGLGNFLSPQIGRLVEFKFVVVYFQPGGLRTFSGYHQRVVPGLLQIVSEISTAVGGGHIARLGRERGQVEAVGAGCASACQRAGGGDNIIFRRKRFFMTSKVVGENFCGHYLAAEVQLPLPV